MRFVRVWIAVASLVSLAGVARAQAPPPSDWSRVQRAVWKRVMISAGGQPTRDARIYAVDDTTITIEDMLTSLHTKFVIERDSVTEIRLWVGSRGSVRDAALGALAGLAVGYLAGKLVRGRVPSCGESCLEENAFIYAVVLAPAALGGWRGYRRQGDTRRLETIYLKP